MSDQGLSDENSPVVAGPDGTGEVEQNSQPEIDWQKRYVDTQEAYTRGQQEIAEMRQRQELYDLMVSTEDQDTRREAALALGYTLEEEPPAPTDDPFVAYDERLGRVEQSLSQREQEQADAEYAAQVRVILDEQLSELGLDEQDGNLVLAYALHALPITDDGLPDIQQAYAMFAARETERQKQWAQSKRAPHIAPHGQSATEVPNLDNRQERQDWMVRRLQENEQAGY